MDMSKLRAMPTNYERAKKELLRQTAEKTLACPACPAINRPGARYIEIDDHDDAYCTVCAHSWQVRIDA